MRNDMASGSWWRRVGRGQPSRLAWLGAIGVAVGSVLRAAHTISAAGRMPPLSEARDHEPLGAAPVTAVVPARNEETVLDRCLDGLRASGHPALRIVVVDDASTDDTATLAARHASADPRIVVTSTQGPPPGWSGKTHAMHVGVRAAGPGQPGEWLLFLDADTEPGPDLIPRLLATAAELDAELVSTPGGPPRYASMVWWLLMPPGTQLICENAAPDGRGRKAFAIGHCILVRRAEFDKVGGWAALRGVGNEDVVLATVVRDAGGRTRTVRSMGTLTSHGMDPLGCGWSSFRKSFSVATQGSLPLLVGAGLAHLAYGLTPPAALLVGCRARRPGMVAAAALGWVAQSAAHHRAARAMGSPRALAGLAPLSWVTFGVVFLDAARYVSRNAIHWKGRPLVSISARRAGSPAPEALPDDE